MLKSLYALTQIDLDITLHAWSDAFVDVNAMLLVDWDRVFGHLLVGVSVDVDTRFQLSDLVLVDVGTECQSSDQELTDKDAELDVLCVEMIIDADIECLRRK
jgi:hypothetical protein